MLNINSNAIGELSKSQMAKDKKAKALKELSETNLKLIAKKQEIIDKFKNQLPVEKKDNNGGFGGFNVDIINEMKEYGCFVDISDYWADRNEVKHEYGLSLIDKYNFDDYQAVILAVSHDEYKKLKISNENKVIFDIKSILPNSDGRL